MIGMRTRIGTTAKSCRSRIPRLAAPVRDLEHERARAQAQRRPDDERLVRPRDAHEVRRTAEDDLQQVDSPHEGEESKGDRAQKHLEEPQAKGVLCKVAKPVERELQALLEQEKENADLAQRLQVVQILEDADAGRSQQEACEQEAKHAAHFDRLRQWHHDDRGGQEDQPVAPQRSKAAGVCIGPSQASSILRPGAPQRRL
eukprot:scaffold1954_cov268-Pinguiococcus_pyrenoidosus.AAC.269